MVPSNIAEGQVRRTDSEVSYFLYISKGSIAEIETQLGLCVRFHYVEKDAIRDSMELCMEVGKMINSLVYKLNI